MENKEEKGNLSGIVPLLLLFYLFGKDEFKNIDIKERYIGEQTKC